MQYLNWNQDSLKNQESEENKNLYNENFDLFDDPPRGWSYICLNETISYYTNNHTINVEELY